MDEVSIICPTLRAHNKLLYVFNEYVAANEIYFNSKKTVSIKYGDPVMKYDKALLNGMHLTCTDNVRHVCFEINEHDLRISWDVIKYIIGKDG